jgi:hypothetical protein
MPQTTMDSPARRFVQLCSCCADADAVTEPFHGPIFRATLGMDDIRASYEQTTADGIEFLRPAMSVEVTGTPVPVMWITFIADPDGVPFEFVRRSRAAFR